MGSDARPSSRWNCDASPGVSVRAAGSAVDVRVDSYIWYNVEKKWLIGQAPSSITFGTLSAGRTSMLVRPKESWSCGT